MAEPVGVQAAVDRLASDLGQSVLIEDLQQYPVWWSTVGAADPVRTKTILDRRVDPLAAAVVTQFKLAQATTPVRTPDMPERGMWARWCMPVKKDGRLLGLLWVLDPDGTVTESDLPRLVDCAEVAAQEMARSSQSSESTRQRRDALVDRLLRAPDEEAARDLARLEDLPHDARVQADSPGRSGGWPLPDGLSIHVATGRARRATSGAALPLVELGEAVRRARATRRAVAAGARLEPESWDQLGAWRFVVDAPADLTVAQVHPGAEVLTDEPHREMETTARVLLDLGGDVAAAARALHIHRTTLYYRLDRILELTGVDVRAAANRTSQQLALWLAAYRRADD
jgi:hypothetical protein